MLFFCESLNDPAKLTAKIAAAYQGDRVAMNIYKTCLEYHGKELFLLIDTLNPEVIIVGKHSLPFAYPITTSSFGSLESFTS